MTAEPVVIWGAGAIGGTIGAHLLRAGRAVLFVDVVAEHVAAINAQGLRIEGPVADFAVPARAVTPDRMQGRHRLILLAVKAHHTEAATRALAPFLAEDGAVVSCQNGLNELVIAELVGRPRTIGAFVNFGADYQAPGRILYGNRGAVVVGELDGARTPRIAALHTMLREFEPDAVLTDNIFGYLWGKAAYGGILKSSALTHDSIADFIADPARRPLIRGITREILRVAAAEGVTPIGFDGFDPPAFLAGDAARIAASLDRLEAYNRASAKSHSGIWRDLAVRKRPTDVAAQLAPVRAAARRHGIPTPMADRLVALIGDIQDGRREIGGALADELGAGMSTTWLMVRAVLADAADVPRFDAWYAAEHLPDAKRAFGALRARRCWSRTDLLVHCAFYEFPDAAAAEAAIASPALGALVAEFDRVWGPRVTRTRELLELAGEA